MEVITFTEEFVSPVPAKRMFKALLLDSDNLLPKLLPQAFKDIELAQGSGGPGSVKKMIFPEGAPVKYLKHRVDAVDEEKLTYAYTLIEGDPILEKVESVSYEVKIEETPAGGCKGKNVTKYVPKAGVEIKEEDIKDKEAEEKAFAVFKAVEAYLLANPNAYA